MASISIALRKHIERLLESKPLEPNEFRRIEIMGSHFMSLDPEHDGQQYFLSMVCGDQEIFIYKDTTTSS